MFNLGFLQSFFVEWGLIGLTIACFVAAFFAFVYIPVFGRPIAYVLIGLGVALLAFDTGWRERGQADNAGAVQAQLDEAHAELAATKQVALDANAAANAAAEVNQAQQEKIRAYENTLKSDPQSGGCGLTDDDVGRLSDIGAGGAPLPPRRPGGLRTPGKGPGPH